MLLVESYLRQPLRLKVSMSKDVTLRRKGMTIYYEHISVQDERYLVRLRKVWGRKSHSAQARAISA